MARFKPLPLGEGDPPRFNQRIDNVIYGFNNQFGQCNSWSYPLSMPSLRFTEINDRVRQADAQYATFDPPRKLTWEEFYSLDYWQLLCLLRSTDGEIELPEDEGLAAFRSTTLARYDQNLAAVIDPPTDDFELDTIPLELTGPPTTLTIPGSGSIPSGEYYWSIFARCSTNAMTETFQNTKKMNWLLTQNIDDEQSTNIQAALERTGNYFNGCCVNVRALIGWRGSVARLQAWTAAKI